MIERLIAVSARHRFVVVATAVVLALLGWRSMRELPLDALPDTGDPQVIVHATWDRSPDLVDAQITYPLVSALLSTPRVKSVRGQSDYGAASVYVIFEEGTDLSWARARTLEVLSTIAPRLPEGVAAALGPDATSVGWVYQYALVDPTGANDARALRAYQDWTLKDRLRAVPGVAEVASVGGFVRQLTVSVDPNRLRAYGLSIQRVADAIRESNRDVGGRVVDSGGSELIVRGLAAAKDANDVAQILVAMAQDGTPIRVADVAGVAIGSDLRRGSADLDGLGEAVSGIVVMRQGENALAVIDGVKDVLRRIEPALPAGVRIVPVYDRSELIHRSIDNLTATIVEVTALVAFVILLFLWHVPSTIVPLITLPLAVLIAFIPLHLFGIGANIMSLAGIAIAVGACVDAAIVVVEQTHKRLEEWERDGRKEDPQSVILGAIQQVGRPAFFALLVIAVSFLPVLTLTGEAGRLFAPLAAAKSLAMVVAAVLAVTVDPALRLMFTRVTPFQFRSRWFSRAVNATLSGTIRPESAHPVTGWVMRRYEPCVIWSLGHKRLLAGVVVVLMLGSIPVWRSLGTEFMPTLDEGTLLYMPSTMPGISMAEASRLLAATDRTLRGFPEVERVLGKAGRADSATDPAPVSMLETVVVLKPQSAWRSVPTWYSSWAPAWARSALRHITPDRISLERLVSEMNAALTIPGVANAWTMPVRGRIDMLTSGIKTSVGLKISGKTVDEIERLGREAATALATVPGTRGVFAEQAGRASFLDVRWDRAALARAGIMLPDAQAAVRYAIGGEAVSTVFSGRERIAVRVSYPDDLRNDAQALGRVLVTSADGAKHVPVAELASVLTTSAPAMLRNDDGLLTGYVYLDTSSADPAAYVAAADRVLRAQVAWPAGSAFAWSGQFESIARMKRQLWEIVPLTLLLIVGLLYVNTRSWPKTAIVLLAVPFSAIGAVGALALLGYHVSIAVWVGLIALMGVDAETGVFMLLYLDESYERARREHRLTGPAGLSQAVLDGASRRVRPKLMTAATMFFGLLPILWSTGTGADVMKRVAAPMVGGILTSFLLELLVYPAVYHSFRSRELFGRVKAS